MEATSVLAFLWTKGIVLYYWGILFFFNCIKIILKTHGLQGVMSHPMCHSYPRETATWGLQVQGHPGLCFETLTTNRTSLCPCHNRTLWMGPVNRTCFLGLFIKWPEKAKLWLCLWIWSIALWILSYCLSLSFSD